MAAIEDKRRSVLITGYVFSQKHSPERRALLGASHVLLPVSLCRCSSGGIGNSLVRGFHRNSLRVFATAREAKTIEELASIGIETSRLIVDDEEHVRQCFAEVKANLGEKGLEYLINNAHGTHPFSKSFVC